MFRDGPQAAEPDADDDGRDGSPPEVDWNVVLEEGAADDNHPRQRS